MAARYPHRGLRSELSCADEGMEIRLRPRCRVPVRVAGRDARFPDTAVALVKGTDAGSDQAAPINTPLEAAETSQGRGNHASAAEHFVPAYYRRLRADASGNDRALLHGLDADAFHRYASDRCVVLVDNGVLY